MVANTLKLSSRGKRVIFNDALRDQVEDQIRNFYFTYELEKPDSNPPNDIPQDQQGIFYMAVDHDDWDADTKYIIYFSSDGSISHRKTGDLLNHALLACINNVPYIFFQEEIDMYKSTTDNVTLEKGQSYAFLTKQTKKDFICNKLDSISDEILYEIICEIDGLHEYCLVYIKSWPNLNFNVIFNGKALNQELFEHIERITFIGGICVDLRSNKYLVNYPPHHINIKGQQLSYSAILKVNNIEVRLVEFLDQIQAVQRDEAFLIEYDRYKARMSIVCSQGKQLSEIGFSIMKDNILSYFPSQRDENKNIYYSFLNLQLTYIEKSEPVFSNGELVKWLSVPCENWIPVNHEEIDKIILGINTENHVSSYLLHLIRKMRISNSVPPKIYKKYLH